jgi:Glycosyl transferase 4-like domain
MVQTPLRILFVSGFVPPLAPIGAVRPGKLEAHWRAAGHDVRTIAGTSPASAIAGGGVSHPWDYYLHYEEWGKGITSLKSSLVHPHDAGIADARAGKMPRLGVADLYRQMVRFPDRYRSWIAPAVRLGLSWQNDWKADVIYSSGPPHSGQVVASRLASHFGIPWIAEQRDLWIGNPYIDQHWMIKPIHDYFARRTLLKAQGFVVVTQQAREKLQRMTDKPVLLSYNGYDPADFEGLEDVGPLDPERLTIVHAGSIYPGRRDPTPLFQAIAALSTDRHKVRCLFYSDANGSVAALARQAGVQDCVEIRPAVPRAEILRVERQADILLECRWIDPAGDGVIPGKLFEYIGAQRPILSLGSLTGEAAAIMRDNALGLVSNDPGEIRTMLTGMLAAKAVTGRVPDLAPTANDKFRRETQFRRIDGLIRDILAQPAPAAAGILAGSQS